MNVMVQFTVIIEGEEAEVVHCGRHRKEEVKKELEEKWADRIPLIYCDDDDPEPMNCYTPGWGWTLI